MLRRATAAALAAFAAVASVPSRAQDRPASYGVEPEVTRSALESRALDLVRVRLAHGGAPPRISSALVLAARELANRAAGGDPEAISRARVRGALARALAHDADVAAVLVVDEAAGAPAALARSLPRRSATHVGAGAVERDGKAWIVLLVSERKLTLDPFPRDVAPGTKAVLAGAILPPLARPRVFVTRPAGEAFEAGGAAGRRFRVPLEFPRPGRYVLEVVGDGEGGPEVAAIVTVSAGGAPLDAQPPPRRDIQDASAAETAVLDALNATRRRYGLGALTADPRIAAVARRHSEAMAAAQKVAHLLPGSGDAGARLRGAGVPYRRALENVARAASALDAHAATEDSPAHLANLLRREPTRVGIGLARSRLPSGEPAVYLTEIFVEPPDDGAESRLTPDARAREALWQERARLGLPPLTSDPGLDALARQAAEGMRARDDTEPGDLAGRALVRTRSVAAVDVFVASAPDEAIRSANLRDLRFRRVGVGVAMGDSRRFGRARLWIAVVYTD